MSNDAKSPEIALLVGSLMSDEVPGEVWFDLGRNPAETEQIGRALAAKAAKFQVTSVVSWLSPDETVLAHIVARELETMRAGVELDFGLFTIESEPPAGSAVLLVSTFWGGQHPLRSLRTLFEERGHAVVAAASLVGPAYSVIGAEDLPLVTLMD